MRTSARRTSSAVMISRLPTAASIAADAGCQTRPLESGDHACRVERLHPYVVHAGGAPHPQAKLTVRRVVALGDPGNAVATQVEAALRRRRCQNGGTQRSITGDGHDAELAPDAALVVAYPLREQASVRRPHHAPLGNWLLQWIAIRLDWSEDGRAAGLYCRLRLDGRARCFTGFSRRCGRRRRLGSGLGRRRRVDWLF